MTWCRQHRVWQVTSLLISLFSLRKTWLKMLSCWSVVTTMIADKEIEAKNVSYFADSSPGPAHNHVICLESSQNPQIRASAGIRGRRLGWAPLRSITPSLLLLDNAQAIDATQPLSWHWNSCKMRSLHILFRPRSNHSPSMSALSKPPTHWRPC